MHLIRIFCLISFVTLYLPALAQKGFDLEIKKPEPYENRLLRAEKSSKTKFTATKQFFQNTYTHFNYFFNANNKLKEVLARAKEANKDDYSKLLPYYNYSLEATKRDKQQLDSIIYKAKTGIVMHDLRNDWIDDLYLLWGASYYLQGELDSAYQMFQFINYAFAPKEKDGYYKYIGSRMDGGNAQTIVTPENEKLLKRITTDPPSRNNAFIWQVRTLTEQNAFAEAGSLIAALRQDPNFPKRLLPDLAEAQGYWFYKQQIWDSAAYHLTNALPNALNNTEKARWEYLIGQLYELSGKTEEAKPFFENAIRHTPDPVLDIWSRLALVRSNKADGEDYISKNIAELEKMVRREKYVDYRDVIYSMMARMELERNNPDAARAYMLKASKVAQANPQARNNIFLNLADLSYEQKQYRDAASYYDSLNLSQIPAIDADRVTERKGYLASLVPQLLTVERQDSLQRIAALPEAERTDYLKKLARQLRRQRGLKEEDGGSSTGSTAVRNADALPDAFRSQQSKGEWYFYNESSRTAGTATFRQVWGNRPNADNWRRAASIGNQANNNTGANGQANPIAQVDAVGGGAITAETLLQTLPLTEQQLAQSNDSIRNALFGSGMVYLNQIEDYPSAIAAFEELRRRFPDANGMADVLYNLHYAYNKTGNKNAAETSKQDLLTRFPNTRPAQTLRTGIDPEANVPTVESTKAYEAVYDMFLEGRFAEAKRAKQVADSTFRTNYWNPQLLYIEAVYHIKQVEDSTAIALLNTLIQQDTEAPIAKKAANLIDVLSRRKQIEEELRNMNVERMKDDELIAVQMPQPKKEETPPVDEKPVEDTVKIEEKPVVQVPVEQPKVDSAVVAKVPEVAPPVEKPVVDTVQKVSEPVVTAPVAEKPKVDSAAIVKVTPPTVQPEKPAVDTAQKTVTPVEEKPVVVAEPEPQLPSVRRDTAQAKTVVSPNAVAQNGKDKVVTEVPAKQPVSLPRQTMFGFVYEADKPHYAVVVLNKVDNIFGNEARTAFARYNADKFATSGANVQLLPLDGDNKLLLIGAFTDVLGAINYVQEVKPIAAGQIVPWLKADKFSFLVISESNLEQLKSNPDLNNYKKFLDSTPVRF